MSRIILSGLCVLCIIFVTPIAVYGLFSATAGLEMPEGASPAQFLTGVFISKTGTAAAFVLIFYLGRSTFSGQWMMYAFLWWLMFFTGEIGQATGPNYSWKESAAGILSETLYLPLSAYVAHLLISEQ